MNNIKDRKRYIRNRFNVVINNKCALAKDAREYRKKLDTCLPSNLVVNKVRNARNILRDVSKCADKFMHK